MRILHTADWHFGKTLEGRDRYDEQKQFVEELCDICEREQVDLVLMAGDVYQTSNPSAAAEELFYEAVVRLSANGTRGVVIIAGNHDNPDRIMAPAQLAARHGIVLLGKPNDLVIPTTYSDKARVQIVKGGASWTELYIPGSEHTAVISALPYPSESRLNKLLSESLDDLEQRKEYNNQLSFIFQQLSTHYRTDTVNLAMSHLYAQGGEMSDSEYQIQVGGAYSVNPSVFPKNAQYVALGHLHRPQEVKNSPVPTRYSGSPLAYSFSETGYQKSVVLLDAHPGKAADIRIVPLSSGKPLVRWKATNGLPQVHSWLDEGRDMNAWIDLEVHLETALMPADIQLLRKLHAGFVNIRPIFPEMVSHLSAEEMRNLPINELFIRFYERQTGGVTPDPELVELFLSLTEEQTDEEAVFEADVHEEEDKGEVAV